LHDLFGNGEDIVSSLAVSDSYSRSILASYYVQNDDTTSSLSATKRQARDWKQRSQYANDFSGRKLCTSI